MKVLLREIQKSASGIEERRDSVFEGDELGIGGAPGQPIQLLGIPALYARLVLDSAGLKLKPEAAKATAATLKVGDTLTIEGHRLRVFAPPPGFNAAVEIRRNLDLPAATFEKAFTTELAQTRLSKRFTGWVLVAAVLLVGLVLPLLLRQPVEAVQPATDAAAMEAGATAEPQATASFSRFVFSDAFWTSGPLSSAHRSAALDNCSACHTSLFGRVPDTACTSCHSSMADHVKNERRTELGMSQPQRCASCHHEHDEPQSHLVPVNDRLCSSCHGSNSASLRAAGLKPATDFSAEDHPGFSARLPRPPGGTNPEWTTERVPLGSAKETSNLKFNHPAHLAGGTVVNPANGQPLQCADCHRASADGQHFEPVTMAQNCSACHSLTFDPDQPDRQLPHGRGHLQEVILTLQDNFIRKAIDPSAKPAPRERRRLPGQAPELELDPVCNSATVACGQARAGNAIRQHFGEKGCGSCHVINENPAADSFVERYSVEPVRLVYDYQPNATFSHRQHRQVGDMGGDAACLSCHKVNTSQFTTAAEQSSELHLPDIARCADCHGGRNAFRKIRSTCMGCHSYHPEAHQ